MRRLCPVLRVALVVWLSLVVGTAAAEPTTARTVLVLGDSLSAAFGIDVRAGWVALLEQRLVRQYPGYRVVNASISGDTTANGLARLAPLLERHRPTVVVVQLGGNDGLRGQPLEQMKHNIVAIVTKAKVRGAKVLVVGVPLPPNYGQRYIERFRQIYREVAREQDVALLPSLLDGIDPGRESIQADGVHPTARAQTRMLENVWKSLQPLL